VERVPGEFDPVLHNAVRLKLVLLIASTTTASFNELARDGMLTRGNLASHLKALETAGYIEAPHMLIDLKPRRRYRLTEKGRDALVAYRESLESAIARIESVARGPLAPAAAEDPARAGR